MTATNSPSPSIPGIVAITERAKLSFLAKDYEGAIREYRSAIQEQVKLLNDDDDEEDVSNRHQSINIVPPLRHDDYIHPETSSMGEWILPKLFSFRLVVVATAQPFPAHHPNENDMVQEMGIVCAALMFNLALAHHLQALSSHTTLTSAKNSTSTTTTMLHWAIQAYQHGIKISQQIDIGDVGPTRYSYLASIVPVVKIATGNNLCALLAHEVHDHSGLSQTVQWTEAQVPKLHRISSPMTFPTQGWPFVYFFLSNALVWRGLACNPASVA